MLMIKAIVRPEKVDEILKGLVEAGYPAVTKYDVVGRGKQKGITVGSVHYDELPKQMLSIVVNDNSKDEIIDIIISKARTGKSGAFGDGKIYITPIEEAYTISSATKGL